MIIGIYSDPHFSMTSSILNKTSGYRYSARLDSLIESYKWMYTKFVTNEVNLIINCGDTTDKDVLRPEENSALYEAMSTHPNVFEYILLGNHERLDKNNKFHSVSLLKGYDNIEVVESLKIVKKDNIVLLMMPYSNDETTYDELYRALDTYSSYDCYVFTHASYIGENYNGYIEKSGLDKVRLTTMYPNIKGIFNGHIHNALDNGLYHQVGSLVGNSFSDNYDCAYPGIIILNTDTNSITRISNPNAILFYKISTDSPRSLSNRLSKLPDNWKCLRVEVPEALRDSFSSWISSRSGKFNIVEYRLKYIYDKVSGSESNTEELTNFNNYTDPYDALLQFTKKSDKLPDSEEEMIKFLNKYVKKDGTNNEDKI